MREQSLAERRDKAPDFNIFRIIGREHYEVTTHSSFLASLLDPLGGHDQGDLFLSRFHSLLADHKAHWKIPAIDTKWRVATETNGIDILLTHRGEQFFIIIENKWFARDQEQQTFRYWQHHRSKQAKDLEVLPVIYLTRLGGEPVFTKEPGPTFRRVWSNLRVINCAFGLTLSPTLGSMAARISPREQHTAVAEPDMRDLDRDRQAVDQHDLVAPVELVTMSPSCCVTLRADMVSTPKSRQRPAQSSDHSRK
jgi:hypothetical protein